MLSSLFQITDEGVRLRAEGLAAITEAPPLPIAGVEAYSAVAPWVLLEDGRLARG